VNEKNQAQALSRARKIQPDEGSEIKEAQAVIEENVKAEEELFTLRGYGGYIKTEHLQAIRATRDEAIDTVYAERNER